jgi:hypothetical protein
MTTTPAPGADKATDERALFEEWAIGKDGAWTPRAINQRVGDGYGNPELNEQWDVWQARATLAGAPVQSQPVAWADESKSELWWADGHPIRTNAGKQLLYAAPLQVPGATSDEQQRINLLGAAIEEVRALIPQRLGAEHLREKLQSIVRRASPTPTTGEKK